MSMTYTLKFPRAACMTLSVIRGNELVRIIIILSYVSFTKSFSYHLNLHLDLSLGKLTDNVKSAWLLMPFVAGSILYYNITIALCSAGGSHLGHANAAEFRLNCTLVFKDRENSRRNVEQLSDFETVLHTISFPM